MKITFLLPGRGWKPVGGVKVVYEYANCLSQRGHEVSVVHPALLDTDTALIDYPKKMIRYVQATVDHSYLPKDWFPIDPRVRMLWVWSLDQKHIPDADVVIATAWQTAEWVEAYSPEKGSKCYLIQGYEHYMTADLETRNRIANTHRFNFQNIIISPVIAEMLRNCEATVHAYVPNGIDFNIYKLKTDFGSTTRRTIGFPSRPENFKGTRDAVAALAKLRQRLGDQIFAWSFGGRKPDYIPSWVKYYERPSDDILCDLYNSSAIFVTASYYEGWGLPGAEAMACGAALVSTENGGVRAYAEHGRTALLSPPNDVDTLAENISLLIHDQVLRQRIAQAGYKNIQQFTWDRACDRLERFLMGLERP